MKKIVEKECSFCDICEKESFDEYCDICGGEICWDCSKTFNFASYQRYGMMNESVRICPNCINNKEPQGYLDLLNFKAQIQKKHNTIYEYQKKELAEIDLKIINFLKEMKGK